MEDPTKNALDALNRFRGYCRCMPDLEGPCAQCKDMAIIRAALQPAPAAQGWMDIATAPRDGTKFWGWHGEDRFIKAGEMFFRKEADRFEFTSSSCLACNPTQWQPLPTPPTAGEKP